MRREVSYERGSLICAAFSFTFACPPSVNSSPMYSLKARQAAQMVSA